MKKLRNDQLKKTTKQFPKVFFTLLIFTSVLQSFAQPVRKTDISSSFGDGVYSSEAQFVEFNNKLYFVGNDDQYGQELFVYDGINTPSIIADINPGISSSSPIQLVVVNNLLCFIANDGVNNSELYKYDGIHPPSRLTNFTTFSPFSSGSKQTICNGILYLFADDGTHGFELWKYDGVNTPSIVADINAGSTSILNSMSSSFMKSFNNNLYFNVGDGITDNPSIINLWKYDGTNPPSLYSNIESASNSSTSDNSTTEFGGLLYYTSYNTGLYKCDGVNPPTLVTSSYATNFIEYKNKIYYSSTDATYGYELWAYDGTNSPYLVADINTGVNSSSATPIATLNNILYLYADNGTNGIELWRYDGVNSPTLVSDINPGAYSSIISNKPPAVLNNILYFVASTANYGEEIWKYDGSVLPSLVWDVNTGTGDGANINYMLTPFNGKLIFDGTEGTSGWELWEYDPNSTTTSITEEKQTNNLKLYPNPSQGCFEISCEDDIQEIIISNSIGQREVFYGNKVCSNFTGIITVQIKTNKSLSTRKALLLD